MTRMKQEHFIQGLRWFTWFLLLLYCLIWSRMMSSLYNDQRTSLQEEQIIRVEEEEKEENLDVGLFSIGTRYIEDMKSPQQVWTTRVDGSTDFQCLGWKETDPSGQKVIGRRPCHARVYGGEIGFCEIMNTTSGEVFQVMRTMSSTSLKEEVHFTCGLARAFSNFRLLSTLYQHDPPLSKVENHNKKNGIAMAVYEKILPSAYASIRHLRSIGCDLPIEIWYKANELSMETNGILRQLVKNFQVIPRIIYDERIEGFYVKCHALYYSFFENVLVLDADNFAVQNPQFLFELDVFQQKGAIFWPDFWHPSNTIFNIHKQSLVWELIDVPFMNSFEQESGQLLVNRTRHADALNILMFYATSHPNLFHKLKLVWGDKDLFRLAWMKAKKEFEMVHFVPGSLGIVNHKRGRFCGMSMVQYDFEGQILFIHRNTIKLTNEMNREETTKHHIWQVLQEIKNPMDFDRIKSFNGLQLFQRSSCFGIKRYDHIETIDMIHVDNLRELVHLEDILLAYAKEAIELTAF